MSDKVFINDERITTLEYFAYKLGKPDCDKYIALDILQDFEAWVRCEMTEVFNDILKGYEPIKETANDN